MAFNSNDGRQQFIATGGQTIFAFNFCIFATSDIKVYKTLAGATPDDALDILILSTNYTVTINGTSGGNVTLLAGSSLNDTITIVRDLPITRTTDYQNNGDLFADTLDSDQDYQTYLIKDIQNDLSRALLLPSTVPSSVSVVLPNPVGDVYFKWNASGTALENDTTIPTAVVTATAQAGIATAKASEALGYRNEAEVFRNDAEAFALSIDPADIVHKSGNETISDIKTFTSFPITPSSAPTTDYEAANKKYVDDNAITPDATETIKGKVELATTAEVQTGTDTTRAVTPAGMKAGLNASGTAPIYACRAWVNFDGTGAGTPLPIRASGNVSSITDNGVGDYTINFATPMLDTNYSVCVSSHPIAFISGALNSGYGGGCGVKHPSTYLTTSVGVYHSVVNDSATASAIVNPQDTDMFNVAIFR